jgi:hypothetical protein
MAGKPKPAFFIVVILIVLGLVGFALYRMGILAPKGKDKKVAKIDKKALDKIKGKKKGKTARRRGPRQERADHGQGVQIRLLGQAAAGQGRQSNYKKLDKARTVKFSRSTSGPAGPRFIFANNGLKPGKVWKDGNGKPFKLELVLIDDPVKMRDAYAAGEGAHRLGNPRHGAAVHGGAAQGLAHLAAHLSAGRLVQRRRRHRRSQHQVASTSCAARPSRWRRTRRPSTSCLTR